MINYSTNRSKYIVKPTIPDGTQVVNYTVIIDQEVIYVGKSRYFGGDYEVDCSDFIESYIAKQTGNVSSASVTVNFTFDDDPTVTAITCSWTPYVINLPEPAAQSPFVYLILTNCGFVMDGGVSVKVPLSFKNGLLDGKTVNHLEKVNYIDKYGDSHNGSMTNHYELECYVDPCWLDVKTKDDFEYVKVALALQGSKKTALYGMGVGISGMSVDTSNAFYIEGKVKDIEQIETYSSYSTDKKVPSYKITFELYR
jgi:hypothetical protein